MRFENWFTNWNISLFSLNSIFSCVFISTSYYFDHFVLILFNLYSLFICPHTFLIHLDIGPQKLVCVKHFSLGNLRDLKRLLFMHKHYSTIIWYECSVDNIYHFNNLKFVLSTHRFRIYCIRSRIKPSIWT